MTHKSCNTPLPEPQCNNEHDYAKNKKSNLEIESHGNSVQYVLTDNKGNKENVEDDSRSEFLWFEFCPRVHVSGL